MQLIYQLFTPSERWPQDVDSLAAAISSQGTIAPEVAFEGDTLVIRQRAPDLTSEARLRPYPAQAYEALLAGGAYQPRMVERDRDTPPIQRQIDIQTVAPQAGADRQAVALFHATVTDGIWWLMGGILADPYRKTVWGWRRWRGDESLAAHAAETAGHLPAAAEEVQR